MDAVDTPDPSPTPVEQCAKDSPSKVEEKEDEEGPATPRKAIEGDEDKNGGYEEPATDRNPEPPAELLGQDDLISADTIGDTVFSKHWLFTTLMRLIQAVDAEGESKESTVTEAGVDLGENLQDELCKLWDMSMNSEVVRFLQEFKAVDIFTGVIAKSKAPRATEICIGILGNMACDEEASKEMAASKKLIELVLLLLSDPDAPTLVETMRLLLTAVSNATYRQPWVTAIRQKDSFLGDLMFILSSSTNNDLLRNTGMFLDKLLDVEDELCAEWGLPQLVTALLEAVKQTGIHPGETLDAYLHIFQLLSTTEMGVTSLAANADDVCRYLLQYLLTVCTEDIVIVEGCENSIASSFSTLNVIVMSSQDHSKYILQDHDLVRCLLKVLDVVYPKIHPEKRERHHSGRHRSRRRTKSDAASSPTHNNNDDTRSEGRDEVVRQDSSQSETSEKESGASEQEAPNAPADRPQNKDPEVEYDRTRTKMLYEVLHGFAGDIVEVLNVQEPLEDTPKSLEYLNSQVPRDRLYSLVWTLNDLDLGKDNPQGSSPSDCHPKVRVMQQTAEIYHLERMKRIIEDALAV